MSAFCAIVAMLASMGCGGSSPPETSPPPRPQPRVRAVPEPAPPAQPIPNAPAEPEAPPPPPPATFELSDLPKYNAHESLYSRDQLEKLRHASAGINITHTALVGHFDGTFREGSKWDTSEFAPQNNEFVLQLAEEFPEEFSAVCMVNPSDPKIFDRIAEYRRRGAVAVQAYSWMFKDGLDSPKYDPFFQYLESHHIPLSLRTGVIKAKGLRAVDNVLSKYRYMRVLIPHYMVSEDAPEHIDYLMKRHGNLYFDLSYGFKNWRSKHFKLISAHVRPLRDLILRFQDRILFGTDVVIGHDSWKTGEYVDKAYVDFVAMLEQPSFTFSVTGATLNGFAFERPILEKLYRANALAFFARHEIAPDAAYLTRISDRPEAPVVEDSTVLLALAAGLDAQAGEAHWADGHLVTPETDGGFYADQRLEGLLPPAFGEPDYLPKDDVVGKVEGESGALGLLFLADLSPHIRLLTIDGATPLDARYRVAPEGLAGYPLVLPAGPHRAQAEDVFRPYDYFSIVVTGCSLIGQGLNEQYEYIPPADLAGDIRSLMHDADVAHISNETAFVPDGTADDKRFTFCTQMRDFDVLPYLGIDVVGLTGNHLVDFGREYFASTLDLFDRYNVGYFGGGRSDDAAACTHIANLFGTRVAFIGYNDVSGTKGVATAELPGSLDLRVDRIRKEIEALRAKSDVIIVDYQVGNEFAPEPTYFQRRVAALAAEAGADGIQFLHSHSMKGYEFLGDAPCFYGPGNFLFFHPSDDFDTTHAYAVKYWFHKKRLVQFSLEPIVTSERAVSLGSKEELRRRVRDLSLDLNRKTALYDIAVADVTPRRMSGLPAGSRLALHFSMTPAKLTNAVAAKPESIPEATSGRVVLIDDPSFLLGGNLDVLQRDDVYVLFGFEDVAALEAFKAEVQKDRERCASLFERFADKILFAPRLLAKPGCRSRSAVYFFHYQLLTAYRNLLERDVFPWPWLTFCGREWTYDYTKEVPVMGLDLPDTVLQKIYSANLRRLTAKG